MCPKWNSLSLPKPTSYLLFQCPPSLLQARQHQCLPRLLLWVIPSFSGASLIFSPFLKPPLFPIWIIVLDPLWPVLIYALPISKPLLCPCVRAGIRMQWVRCQRQKLKEALLSGSCKYWERSHPYILLHRCLIYFTLLLGLPTVQWW